MEVKRGKKRRASKSPAPQPEILTLSGLNELLDTKLNSLKTELKKDIAEVKKDVATVQELVGLLLSANPKAIIDLIAPMLVGPSDLLQVKNGATATFTFVQDVNGKFWAFGSAHSVFYYSGVFATLPREICQLGVKSVRVYPQLMHKSSCLERRYDVVVIELINDVPDYHSKFIWDPNDNDDPLATQQRNVGGLSTSGYVIGAHLTYDPTEKVFIFVEEAGEPGHSGTLIFATAHGSATLVGVYQGTLDSVKNMRARAVVVPVHLTNMREYRPQPIPDSVQLGVPQKGHIVPQRVQLQKYKTTTASYRDGSHQYFGVVLGKAVAFCGAACVGNVQRHK